MPLIRLTERVIRKVESGELPDDRLVDVEKLIKRALQDADDPHPDSNLAKLTPEQLKKFRDRWQGLFDRMEKARLTP